MYIGKIRLNSNKTIRYSLTQLTGIGQFLANQISDYLGFKKILRLKDIQRSEREKLTRILGIHYKIGLQLKLVVKQAKRRLIQIRTLRGRRLKLGLPVRGQRTRTNARTCRKKR